MRTTIIPKRFDYPFSVSVWKVAKFLILVEDSDFVTNVINVGKRNAPYLTAVISNFPVSL